MEAETLERLKYRMEQMSTADSYLSTMGIATPEGKQCYEFDTKSLHERIDLIFDHHP